jgi:hypothetical protein
MAKQDKRYTRADVVKIVRRFIKRCLPMVPPAQRAPLLEEIDRRLQQFFSRQRARTTRKPKKARSTSNA